MRKATAVTIRRAQAGDASTVRDLILALADHQNQADAVTVTDLEGMLSRPEIVYLIAERDGRPVGYVSWLERTSFWSGDEYLALDDLFVAESERGNGIGERLMHAAADAAKGKVIRWEVAEANVAAQRFYERIGARLVSKKICRWQPH
ncbi:GNAT family N-acetyltransferase [Herbidospora daliensis]|uniref:GNAT family N-acetyltransferase n=1 Tax=Herbidospora daliensis TaxID=295585 RepID=UPI0007853F2A|nr:GNAT family N-acetyltransferase [Herbidospora daliensis]